MSLFQLLSNDHVFLILQQRSKSEPNEKHITCIRMGTVLVRSVLHATQGSANGTRLTQTAHLSPSPRQHQQPSDFQWMTARVCLSCEADIFSILGYLFSTLFYSSCLHTERILGTIIKIIQLFSTFEKFFRKSENIVTLNAYVLYPNMNLQCRKGLKDLIYIF